MIVERLVGDKNIDSRKVVLSESLKERLDLPFDPKRDIPELVWKKTGTLLDMLATNSTWHRFAEYYASACLLDAERFTGFRQYPEVWDGMQEKLDSKSVNVFEHGANMKLLAPLWSEQFALSKKDLKNVKKTLRELQEDESYWLVFHKLLYQSKIIFPRKEQLDTSVYWDFAKKHMNGRVQKKFGDRKEMLANLRVVYPEHIDELQLTSKEWVQEKAIFERSLDFDFLLDGKTVMRSAVELSILSADKITVTESDISLTFPQLKKRLETNYSLFPEVRKF